MLHIKFQGKLVPEKRFFKIFTVYGRGGHIGDLGGLSIFCSSPWRLFMILGYNWLRDFGGDVWLSKYD